MTENLDSRFSEIITNKKQYTFSVFALNLMFTRLKSRYSAEPTDSVMKECLSEVNTFIVKFEKILVNDLAQLKNA